MAQLFGEMNPLSFIARASLLLLVALVGAIIAVAALGSLVWAQESEGMHVEDAPLTKFVRATEAATMGIGGWIYLAAIAVTVIGFIAKEDTVAIGGVTLFSLIFIMDIFFGPFGLIGPFPKH